MSDAAPVWVTGAAGFLGGAVCRRLCAEGLVVQPVVGNPRQADGFADRDGSLPALVCDLSADDPALGRAGAGNAGVAAVVHFAARIPASGEPAEAEEVALENQRIDQQVFRFAAEHCAPLVFASSGSVYGEGHGQVFEESGPTAPRIPYAAAKLESEVLGAELMAGAGGAFTALRISAPYGAGQRTATVARIFMTRALAGEDLAYHGSGRRSQDFVHVDDVAAAVVAAIRTPVSGVFNIASGRPVSTRELAETVVEVVGGDAKVVASGNVDDQEERTALYSIDAARRALGWQPATSLATGLRRWRDHLIGAGA